MINSKKLLLPLHFSRFLICWALVVSLVMGGCQLLPMERPAPQNGTLPPAEEADSFAVSDNTYSDDTVEISVQPIITQAQRCSGQFVAHELAHVTMTPGGETISMFEANGGGVAINDLDGDGWQDIVLANHRDPNTILWNEGTDEDGALQFTSSSIGIGDSRAVATVDVDGDGQLDIVFSRRVSAPNYWRNTGQRNFEQRTLPGVSKPLYAINWADLDLDGDLDLVGGTYDAGLLAEFGNDFLNSSDAGVYVYWQDEGVFQEQPLALSAQALALALVDINNDLRPDILVGNDFGVPDYLWLNLPLDEPSTGAEDSPRVEWVPQSFAVMSHSTMSYAAGDINNDGDLELLSTDMMPYADDPETMAAWAPVMESMMEEEHDESDPQIMANVMHQAPSFVEEPLTEAQVSDLAPEFGINASGWSWSGKFGDLNQDGLLDLYIVNGMIESTTFAHLPNHELMEENQAYRNADGLQFLPAPEWQLNATESGRGMSMADLDNDGDLDIVVNNLRAAAKLFENQLCEGNSLLVDLEWQHHTKRSINSRAIGSMVVLEADADVYRRQVEVASGYLSGDSTQLHFGFENDVQLERLIVQWPDGDTTVISNVAPNQRVRIERKFREGAD